MHHSELLNACPLCQRSPIRAYRMRDGNWYYAAHHTPPYPCPYGPIETGWCPAGLELVTQEHFRQLDDAWTEADRERLP